MKLYVRRTESLEISRFLERLSTTDLFLMNFQRVTIVHFQLRLVRTRLTNRVAPHIQCLEYLDLLLADRRREIARS